MEYIKPSLRTEEAQAVSMIAESLKISEGTKVDGADALTNENTAWDIWGEE